MREPPGLPITSATLPSFSTIVGVIDDTGRRPGAIVFASSMPAPGFATKSSIASLSRNPPPSTTTPEPNEPLSVYVFDTALPHLSTTEKCVVWGFSGGGASPEAEWVGAAAPSGCAGVGCADFA